MLYPFKVIATRLGARCRVLLADLRGAGNEGQDDEAEPYDGAEVRQPLGLFVRPAITASLVAWAIRMGDQVKPLFLVDKSQPVFGDVEEGETRLYGAKESSCRIRLRADGSIDIEAKSGVDIRINGGTHAIGRVGDQVQVSLTVTEVAQISAPPGTAGGPCTATGPITLTGSITAGAPNAKA